MSIDYPNLWFWKPQEVLLSFIMMGQEFSRVQAPLVTFVDFYVYRENVVIAGCSCLFVVELRSNMVWLCISYFNKFVYANINLLIFLFILAYEHLLDIFKIRRWYILYFKMEFSSLEIINKWNPFLLLAFQS